MNDDILQLYRSLEPGKYMGLDEIVIRQDTPAEGIKSYVTVELRLSGLGAEDGILHLRFDGVVDLRVSLPSEYNQIGYIEIVSICDQQWEQFHYRVSESEHSALSFYCASFEVWRETILPPED